MGGAPSISWVRDGVGFEPAAAASFRRAEASWGSPIDVNSSYREYLKQLSMWAAYQDYIAGRGPYPGHGFALHPDASMHCRGLAFDSDDWTRPGFVEHMAEHGWIRTALHIEEWWHFDRQPWRDKHINDPAPAYFGGVPFEEDDMSWDEKINGGFTRDEMLAKTFWQVTDGIPGRKNDGAQVARLKRIESATRANGAAIKALAEAKGIDPTPILAAIEEVAERPLTLSAAQIDQLAERINTSPEDMKAAMREVFAEAFAGDGGDTDS
jgi:hypothetical protein